MSNRIIEKGKVLEVDIIDLTYEGRGVAKIDGFPIFIENTLPGEKASIKITRVKNRYAYGTLVKIINPSSDRIEVKEKHEVLNSTIPLQHLTYEKQLEFKTKLVKDAFAKDIQLKTIAIKDAIGMENPWHYRNKTQVPVRTVHGEIKTGVFSKRSHHLIPVDNFRINLEGIDEIVVGIREILGEFNEKPYDDRTHTGNIRHIIVRQSYTTNEVMVIIVTRSKSLFPVSKIVPAITEKFPNVVSIIQNINNKKSSTILGDTSKTIYGKETYEEVILGKTFDVSPQSFLQVNVPQAEVLYNKAIDLLDIKETDIVLDAYCGIGTIALNLADKAKEVIGIEVVSEAVEAAQANATKNNITNVSFECGLVEEVVSNLAIKPNIVVVDPPRAGLEDSFVNYLIELAPETIAYVSCNPSTLARDLSKFVTSGYSVIEVQPVDMFPQTVHVETVVLLQK